MNIAVASLLVPGVVLVAILVTGCLGGHGCSSEPRGEVSESEARSLLIDRNWIQRWPASKDDRLHVFRFVPRMGGGVYQDRTLFLGYFELFQFEVSGRTVRFHFPDMDERVTSRFRIERIHGHEPFDLALRLDDSPRGPAVYYSVERDTGASGEALDALLRKHQP